MFKETVKMESPRRGRCVSSKSTILVLEMGDIEMVVNEGTTLDMSDNEEVIVPEKMNDISIGRTDGDEPLVTAIGDVLSSVAFMVEDSTVSSPQAVMQSNSFDLNVFKKQVRSCKYCRKIACRGVNRSILEIGFKKK